MPTLSMKRSRFREKAGFLAWKRYNKTDTETQNLKQSLEKLLPRECIQTRTFRDLPPTEIEQLKVVNGGLHPERGRKG
jgi:hypothetical protein